MQATAAIVGTQGIGNTTQGTGLVRITPAAEGAKSAAMYKIKQGNPALRRATFQDFATSVEWGDAFANLVAIQENLGEWRGARRGTRYASDFERYSHLEATMLRDFHERVTYTPGARTPRDRVATDARAEALRASRRRRLAPWCASLSGGRRTPYVDEENPAASLPQWVWQQQFTGPRGLDPATAVYKAFQ